MKPYTAVKSLMFHKYELSPINGIIRDKKIFQERYIYMYVKRVCGEMCQRHDYI